MVWYHTIPYHLNVRVAADDVVGSINRTHRHKQNRDSVNQKSLLIVVSQLVGSVAFTLVHNFRAISLTTATSQHYDDARTDPLLQNLAK